MIALGLGTLRARVKGRIGIFFRAKKNGDQRMVIDCRDPNQGHRRSPHLRLGTPATIAAVDLSATALRCVGEQRETVAPHIAMIDLRDSFYQFSVPRMASWFCAAQGETTAEWGVSQVQAMPMGWAWALYFCQAIMSGAVEEGLSEERARAPRRPRRRSPCRR